MSFFKVGEFEYIRVLITYPPITFGSGTYTYCVNYGGQKHMVLDVDLH